MPSKRKMTFYKDGKPLRRISGGEDDSEVAQSKVTRFAIPESQVEEVTTPAILDSFFMDKIATSNQTEPLDVRLNVEDNLA